MKKYILIITAVLLYVDFIFAHCQVPCGIYDDAARIIQIREDFETIQKSISKINSLSDNSDPLTFNQINRWIITKENHASNIQKVVSEYFLTQRIKVDNGDKYVDQVTILHKILIEAMKCKQTVNPYHVNNGIELIDKFCKSYFDNHGLEHLNTLIK
tara:strand:- start:438 stop:908 length:471 start_codon:yes stop_codon:yes gene_type:complete